MFVVKPFREEFEILLDQYGRAAVFASLMSWCENNGVDFVFGLVRNQRLRKIIGAQMHEAIFQHFVAKEAAVKYHGLVNIPDRQCNVIHTCSTEEPSLPASLWYPRRTEHQERIAPSNPIQ